MKRRVLRKVITARGEEIICDVTPNLSRQNSGDLNLREMEGHGAQGDQPPTSSTASSDNSKTNSSTQHKPPTEPSSSLTVDSLRPSPQRRTPQFLGSAFVATVLAASAAADVGKKPRNAVCSLGQTLSDDSDKLKPPVSLEAERHPQLDGEVCSPEIIISLDVDESERRSSRLGIDLSNLTGDTSVGNRKAGSSSGDELGSIASTTSNSPARSERSKCVNDFLELQKPEKISLNTSKSDTAEEVNGNDLGLKADKDVPDRSPTTDAISTPMGGVLNTDSMEIRNQPSSNTTPVQNEPTSSLSQAEKVGGSEVVKTDSQHVPSSRYVLSIHLNTTSKTNPEAKNDPFCDLPTSSPSSSSIRTKVASSNIQFLGASMKVKDSLEKLREGDRKPKVTSPTFTKENSDRRVRKINTENADVNNLPMSGNKFDRLEHRTLQSTEKIHQWLSNPLNPVKSIQEDEEIQLLRRPRLSVRNRSLPDVERGSMSEVSGSGARSSSFDVSSLTTEHTITWSQHKRFSEEHQIRRKSFSEELLLGHKTFSEAPRRRQGTLQTTQVGCQGSDCGSHWFKGRGDIVGRNPRFKTEDSVQVKALVGVDDRSNVQETRDNFNGKGPYCAIDAAEGWDIHDSHTENISQKTPSSIASPPGLSAFRSCSRNRSRSPLNRWEPADQNDLVHKAVDDQWGRRSFGEGDVSKDEIARRGLNMENGSGETLPDVTAQTLLKLKLDAEFTSSMYRFEKTRENNNSGSGSSELKVPTSEMWASKNNNPDWNNSQRKTTSLSQPGADLNFSQNSKSHTGYKVRQCHTNHDSGSSHSSDSELTGSRISKDTKRAMEGRLNPIGGGTENIRGKLQQGRGRADRLQSQAGPVGNPWTKFNPCVDEGQDCGESTAIRCLRMSKKLKCKEPSFKRPTRTVSVAAAPHVDLASLAGPSMTRVQGGGQSARVKEIPDHESAFSDGDQVYVQRRRRPVYKLDTRNDQCPEQVRGDCCRSQDAYYRQLSRGRESQEIEPHSGGRVCRGQLSGARKSGKSGAVDPEGYWDADTVASALTHLSGNSVDELYHTFCSSDYDDVFVREKGATAKGNTSMSSSRIYHPCSGVEPQNANSLRDNHPGRVGLYANNRPAEVASPISPAIGSPGFRDNISSPERQSQCYERLLTPTKFRPTHWQCSYPTTLRQSSDYRCNQMSEQIRGQSNIPSGGLDWDRVRKPDNRFVPISTEDFFKFNGGTKNLEGMFVSRGNSFEKEGRGAGEGESAGDPSTTARLLTPTRFREEGSGQCSGQSSGEEEFAWPTHHFRDRSQRPECSGQVQAQPCDLCSKSDHNNESTSGLWSSVRQQPIRDREVSRYKNEPTLGHNNVTCGYDNLPRNTIPHQEGQIYRHPPLSTHSHEPLDESCYHPNGDIHPPYGSVREPISDPRESSREDSRHLAKGDYFRQPGNNKSYKPITTNSEHFNQADAFWLGSGEMSQPLNSSRVNTMPLNVHFNQPDSVTPTDHFAPSIQDSEKGVSHAGILKVSSSNNQQKDTRSYPLSKLNPHLSNNSGKISTKTTGNNAIASSKAFSAADSNNACDLDSQSIVDSLHQERKEEFTNMNENVGNILSGGNWKPHKSPTPKYPDSAQQLKLNHPHPGVPIRRKRKDCWSEPVTLSSHDREVLGIFNLHPWPLSPYAKSLLSNMSSSRVQKSNPGPDIDASINKNSDSHQNPSFYPSKPKALQRGSQPHRLDSPDVGSPITQSHSAGQHPYVHRCYSLDALDDKVHHSVDTVDRKTDRSLEHADYQGDQISASYAQPGQAIQSLRHCSSENLESTINLSTACSCHAVKETDQNRREKYTNKQHSFPTGAHPTNLNQTAVHPKLKPKICSTSQLNHQQNPTFQGLYKRYFPYVDPNFDLKTFLATHSSPIEQSRSPISLNPTAVHPKLKSEICSTSHHQQNPTFQGLYKPYFSYVDPNFDFKPFLATHSSPIEQSRSPISLNPTAVHQKLKSEIYSTSQLNHQQNSTFQGLYKPNFPYFDPNFDLKTFLATHSSPIEQSRSQISLNQTAVHPKMEREIRSTSQLNHQENPTFQGLYKPYFPYFDSNYDWKNFLATHSSPTEQFRSPICRDMSQITNYTKESEHLNQTLHHNPSSQPMHHYPRSQDMPHDTSIQDMPHDTSIQDRPHYPIQDMSRHHSQLTHTQAPQFRDPWSGYRDSQTHPPTRPNLAPPGQPDDVQSSTGHCRDHKSVRLLRQSTVDTLDSGITEGSSQHW